MSSGKGQSPGSSSLGLVRGTEDMTETGPSAQTVLFSQSFDGADSECSSDWDAGNGRRLARPAAGAQRRQREPGRAALLPRLRHHRHQPGQPGGVLLEPSTSLSPQSA